MRDQDVINTRVERGTPAHEGGDRRAVILLVLDGSPTSWNAFWWGCGEAQRQDASAIAVYVSPQASLGVASLSCAVGIDLFDHAEFERLIAEQAARLSAEAHRNGTAAGVDLQFVHARGEPATELLRLSQQTRADRIVVGAATKASRRLTRALRRRRHKHSAPVLTVVP